MNKSELIADLKTKCVMVFDSMAAPKAGAPDVPGAPQTWVVPIVEIGAEGTVKKPRNYEFGVMNTGVVAGPQTHANDVYEQDPSDPGNPEALVLTHSAGDPILDENGVQVVIPAQMGETVFIYEQIKTPTTDTMIAIGYLEAQRAAGTWLRYVEDDQGPKRPDLKFFAIKAWVDQGNGTVAEKRFMVAYDEQGQPFHSEIV